MNRTVNIRSESWPCITPFRISSNVWYDFPCIVCEITEDGIRGRGEAMGVMYLGETLESMTQQIEAISAEISRGIGRQELINLLPAGGARLAVDSALWDLEAQLSGISAWQTAGVEPGPIETVPGFYKQYERGKNDCIRSV